jgi:hypothetical protein
MKEINLPRTGGNVEFNIELLNKMGIEFSVQHGTYTTIITTEEQKIRYMMNTYNPRVFKCAQMIKSDVLKSSAAQQIMQSKFLKTNFGISQNKKSFNAKEVLNIDITSAYARCLMVNGLITEKTYNIIRSLPKTERLPCVGMLATSHCTFSYKNGKCIDVKKFRAETANIFFYLIDEINYLMQEIEFLLGEKFIFYWVDGVFFNYDTPAPLIQEIETFLDNNGYSYKYENVRDFKVSLDDKKMSINMIKNEKNKQYLINTENVSDSIKEYLNSTTNQQ